MTKDKIVLIFGNQTKISKIIGRKRAAISQWGKTGVPADCQRIFYYMTNGKLIPSPDVSYVPIEEVKKILEEELEDGK